MNPIISNSLTTRIGLLFPCILLFISCTEEDISPISGTYTGEVRVVKWDFEELQDEDGNFAGVQETRDTLFSQGEVFSVSQVGKEAAFTVAGESNLSRINGFSSHEFTYQGPQAYSVVNRENGVETKRLELSFDGAGGVELFYTENQLNDDLPPIGQEIQYSGRTQWGIKPQDVM